jgi:protein-S-isoprenylcysteine O-methyltransferase
MMLDIIVSIVLAVAWTVAEIWLVARDRRAGKGTTTQDRTTRNYNALAVESALCLPPLIAWTAALRFLDFRSPIVFWAGVLVACLGFLLRHWSIRVLGRYFRTTVEVDRDHRVVRTGPYRYVRHPAYSGIILFFVGYGLMMQNAMALVVAVALPTAALLHRIGIEEAALAQGIGADYRAYQQTTKRLIPAIW